MFPQHLLSLVAATTRVGEPCARLPGQLFGCHKALERQHTLTHVVICLFERKDHNIGRVSASQLDVSIPPYRERMLLGVIAALSSGARAMMTPSSILELRRNEVVERSREVVERSRTPAGSGKLTNDAF